MSNFQVGNQGDSDFDAMAVSVCNDCRYGVAWYKLATVIFDLGTGAQPTWANKRVVYGANHSIGGVTWYHGQDQWLLTASGVGDACVGTSTLYRLAGLANLPLVACITAGARSLFAQRGLYDRGNLYVSDVNTRLYRYQAGTAGLTYVAEMGRAAAGGNSGTGLDVAGGMLVAASSLGATLWDATDPALPIPTTTIPGNYYRATIAPPLLVLATVPTPWNPVEQESVWDISNPTEPQSVAVDLHPDTHPCQLYQSSTLAEDMLYSWRWSIAESFDLSNCAVPPASDEIFVDGFESGTTSAWGDDEQP